MMMSYGLRSVNLLERPALLFLLLLSSALVVAGLYSVPFALTSAGGKDAAVGSGIKKNTVPLDLFVMSRCVDKSGGFAGENLPCHRARLLLPQFPHGTLGQFVETQYGLEHVSAGA